MDDKIEIRVDSLAGATAKFEVSMIGEDVPPTSTAEATVDVGLVGSSRAALKKTLSGPCPPTGQHTYYITAVALDAAGKGAA